MPHTDLKQFSYLVIDDDDMARDVLGSTLNFIGATRVFFAQGAADAYRLAQLHRPDFVLLDIYMPDTDGWQVLAQLRQLVPQAAILMVTGTGRQAEFNESLEQRVDGFCIKPVAAQVMKKGLLNARHRKQKSNR